MKIIDNFDLIQDLLEFPNNDEFYYLQIMQRKKMVTILLQVQKQ